MIRTKRAYEKPDPGDGDRFLVDRLWPRGIAKDSAKLVDWVKVVAPSDALRKWYGNDSGKWKEFQRRYVAELQKHPETWESLLKAAREGNITLVFGKRDTEHNNAVALKSFLENKLRKSERKQTRQKLK
jgi:uncharacterized protein YeaO (DUF488 family)